MQHQHNGSAKLRSEQHYTDMQALLRQCDGLALPHSEQGSAHMQTLQHHNRSAMLHNMVNNTTLNHVMVSTFLHNKSKHLHMIQTGLK